MELFGLAFIIQSIIALIIYTIYAIKNENAKRGVIENIWILRIENIRHQKQKAKTKRDVQKTIINVKRTQMH